MPLAPGTRLGPYDVVSAIGAGGMGEVYRARDTKLNRDVALKILPDTFAADPDRLMRFRREAQVLAALNHPNIGHIYGFEDSGSSHALVLELVDGLTVADRIAQGPIAPSDALNIASQIADALEAAHEQGIVHRDLKPANVKVREDGTVKVLDFGLAKALDPALVGRDFSPAADAMSSPTMTSPARLRAGFGEAGTELGMILGTAAYMSPEQARGKPVDKRTDIWAFGALLFEMLSGARAFAGDQVSEMLAAVLKDEPRWDTLPRDTPPAVRRLLERCLEKDPKQRLRDIGDARHELEWEADAATPTGTTAATDRRQIATGSVVAAVLAGMLIGGAAIYSLPTRDPNVSSLVFQLASGEQPRTARISPDGREIVYARQHRLVVRVLETGDIRELEGTDGAGSPFWSRDGRSIGFIRDRNLTVVPVRGGASRVVTAPAWAPAGAAWCSDDITFSIGSRRGWSRVAPDGRVQSIIAPDPAQGESQLMDASCLPDGRILGIITREREAGSSIAVFGGPATIILHTQPAGALSNPVWSPSGHVFFQRGIPNAGIWSLPVSSDVSRAEGVPSLVLAEGLEPDVSATGTLLALTGLRTGESQLQWVDRAGRALATVGRKHDLRGGVAASPDGTRVAAIGRFDSRTDPQIWIHRGETAQRLTEAVGRTPVWSRAGDRIAYAASTPEPGLFVQPGDGSGIAQRVAAGQVIGADWSPDGRSLVYVVPDGRYDFSVWTMAADGTGQRLLLKDAEAPAISPDGKWLAYQSQSRSNAILLTSLPSADKIWPVSAAGDSARHPRWHPRGGELFYAAGPTVGDDPGSERDLYSVKIDTRSGVVIGEPQRLFNADALGFRLVSQGGRAYDVGPDGERFVVATSQLQGEGVLTVVQNVGAWMRQTR